MSENRKTVLVVDDAPENIRVLSAILGVAYRVKAAPGGEKALQVCAADPPPDLVLLDILMPGMDGWEVCRRLKTGERTASIPVIFVTGTADEGDRARAAALGAAGVLVKPLDPADVLARVAAVV
jgi:two-component system, OmpR family, alkaline phosphatase synthesis response regulator PhoP